MTWGKPTNPASAWGTPAAPPKPAAPWGGPSPAPVAPKAPTAPEIETVPMPTGPALNAPKPRPVAPPPKPQPTTYTEKLDPFPDGFKPTPDMLVAVVRTYLTSMSNTNMPSSVREPHAWEKQAAVNREILEHNLKVMGFADVLEWE